MREMMDSSGIGVAVREPTAERIPIQYNYNRYMYTSSLIVM